MTVKTKKFKKIKTKKIKTKKLKTKKLKTKYKTKHKKSTGGGVVCPKTGFHQHLGECWNDSLMMIFCYANGINRDVQNFFNYLTSTTQGKSDDEIIEQINVAFKRFDTPDYKTKNSYKIPLNIDIDNEDEYNLFRQSAIDYISNMYFRYMNETAFIKKEEISTLKGTRPLTRVALTREKSFDTSILCIEANFRIYNTHIIPSMERKFNMDKHGGNIITNIISLSYINYFLMGFKSFLTIKYINLKNIKNIKKLETQSTLKDTVESLSKINDIILDSDKQCALVVNILPDETAILHTISFFECNTGDSYTNSYYYNDNGIDITNSDEVLYKLNWKKYFSEKIYGINRELNKISQFHSTPIVDISITRINEISTLNDILIYDNEDNDKISTLPPKHKFTSLECYIRENYNLENVCNSIFMNMNYSVYELSYLNRYERSIIIKNLGKKLKFIVDNFKYDNKEDAQIYATILKFISKIISDKEEIDILFPDELFNPIVESIKRFEIDMSE